ncbi:MAG: ABC transporter ATP-binding protein, partial [Proteobacteria bacterium]|nr:ABC transporter ATP-binding protein [Pseudomonadota bacterium]
PTNDLDIDTLELLEELLQDYAGTVFLVSHDRRFLDNVVTSTIAFEGDGRWREYEGGVTDWLVQSARAQAAAAPDLSKNTPKPAPVVRSALQKRKLSYKEQRELEALPSLIDTLEQEQREIHDALADGSLYGSDAKRAAALAERSTEIENELMAALERWEALGSLAN